ncbi:ISAzo13-like element transposase-related protein [Nodosilinea nodulosa]|uniref:ISAzo13-like element transposase-related protein n=1 Tax=Nodosilinea nodulosa TaxID=416001 RepID=UPI000A04BE4C
MFVDTFRFPHIYHWVINADDDLENHSRHTQFMAQLVDLARRAQIMIQLVYYPPYHSKYNFCRVHLWLAGVVLARQPVSFGGNSHPVRRIPYL